MPFTKQKILPDNHGVLYDESKVPVYSLPEPLTLLNGSKVLNKNDWLEKRRREILKLFETYVYGRNPVESLKKISWKVISQGNNYYDVAVKKYVTIFLEGIESGPKINVEIIVPEKAGKPLPAFIVPGWMNNRKLLIKRGYILIHFDPRKIQPDKTYDTNKNSIRNFYRPVKSQPDNWGTIAVWSWSLSRVMDYVENDPDIDSGKVCIMGLSRFGKAVMWSGAQDQRFAIVFSCESGCGGAAIIRRQFGETIKAINEKFPHWFNDNFKKFNNNVSNLPVDWHMLIALVAPRPVYIATAQEDYWGDPKGAFLAGKNAEPVYGLFNKKGLCVNEMPEVDKPVGDYIAFHKRKGGHGLKKYDWMQFLNFADRHLAFIKNKK